jgi:ABC-type polysaccharide/polyol phosphate export permease
MAPGLPPVSNKPKKATQARNAKKTSQYSNSIRCANKRCLKEYNAQIGLDFIDRLVTNPIIYLVSCGIITIFLLLVLLGAPEGLQIVGFVCSMPAFFFLLVTLGQFIMIFCFCVLFDALNHYKEIWEYLKGAWCASVHNAVKHDKPN